MPDGRSGIPLDRQSEIVGSRSVPEIISRCDELLRSNRPLLCRLFDRQSTDNYWHDTVQVEGIFRISGDATQLRCLAHWWNIGRWA